MKGRIPARQWGICCLLGAITLAASAAGCAPDSSEPITTASQVSSTSVPSTNASVTTSLPQTLSEYDRELAKTAKVQLKLATYLSEQQAPQDDPRMAIIYGLRARTQALTCRKALSTNDLALADTAMRDIYATLNLSRAVAAGPATQVLTDAREIVATVGAPSDNPDQAAALLDQFIAALAPLLDEATAITPTTTSP